MPLKILIALVVIVVVLVVLVATRPSEFRVSRTAAMAAPPPVVFAQVMKKSFEGAPAGVGASYAWSGNREVGEGRTTIVESRPNELIRIKLEFVRPFTATSTAEFTFKPEGERTAVTWSLDGRNNFVGKAMGLFINMDRMIGSDFDTGLAQMKAVVEAVGQR